MNPFQTLLEKLTGQTLPFQSSKIFIETLKLEKLELGYSQFNELLLYCGYDRISYSFFQFLVDGTTEYKDTSAITSVTSFAGQIDKFIEISLRLFGNIKYGFKQLSAISSEDELIKWVDAVRSRQIEHFTSRHTPLFDIKKIDADKTYYLGYIVQGEIEKRLQVTPGDTDLKKQKAVMDAIVQNGIDNHNAYLASDHMDVYVATSMRLRHEFLFVSRFINQVFSHPSLSELKIRLFDPTQAFCKNRIDKGISEALMLKRADCTIYLAQESDTLGKDSELASTLAQGKTVIAYIPFGDNQFVDRLLVDIKALNAELTEKQIIIEQLKIYDPLSIWTDERLRKWVFSDTNDIEIGMARLYKAVEEMYNKRAITLKDAHPLGIQVNLETGVANGVIVTREINECVELVRRVLMGELKFDVVEQDFDGIKYSMLKEQLTGSIFRVASGDKILTNTFWNYYLNP